MKYVLRGVELFPIQAKHSESGKVTVLERGAEFILKGFELDEMPLDKIVEVRVKLENLRLGERNSWLDFKASLEAWVNEEMKK